MTSAKWTKQQIIQAIQAHHRQGKPLTSIWRENRTLMAMAWKHFGSWHNAVVAAGFPSKPRRKWSKESLIEALRAIAPHNYTFSQIREMDPSLGYAARMQFGGWHAALKAAGLPQIEHWNRQRVLDALRDRQRRGLLMTRMRYEDGPLYSAAIRCFGSWRKALAAIGVKPPLTRRWSKESVVAELRRRHDRRCDMSRLCRKNASLRGAAAKHLGSWRRAVVAAGLTPVRRQWSRQRVIEILQERHRDGRTLAQVWKEDPSLYNAAKRFCGSWTNALAAAGIRPNRQCWTAKRVVKTIRARLTDGMSIAEMWKDCALSSAAGLYFGARNAALSAAGIQAQPPRRWTKTMVLDAIRARRQKGLTMACIGRHDRALATAANRRFGSWRKAMEAAGLEPIHKKWSHDQIIRELRDWSESGSAKRNIVLDSAAIRYFGSMQNAYQAAGIETQWNGWSKQRVIDMLQDRYIGGKCLCYRDCEDRSLATAAQRLFGRWDNALSAAGLDVTLLQRDRTLSKACRKDVSRVARNGHPRDY